MKYAIEFAMLAAFIAVGFAANSVGEDEEDLVLIDGSSAKAFSAQESIGLDKSFTILPSFDRTQIASPDQTIVPRTQDFTPAGQESLGFIDPALLRKITNDDIARMRAAGIGMTSDPGPVQNPVAL